MKVEKLVLQSLGDYAVAPYNFVSLPEQSVARYKDREDLPAHNVYKHEENKELLNGYIQYQLVAETPIIVFDGNNKGRQAYFFKNSNGQYAIPGNTIRGMVRSNAQILSLSSLVGQPNEIGEYPDSDISNTRFMFREIAANDALGEKYKQILNIDQEQRISRALKTGYIYKKGEDYYIQPAVEVMAGKPYQRLDERTLRRILDPDTKGVQFMYTSKDLKWKNKSYAPYMTPVSFILDNINKKIKKIGNPGQYQYNGYLLSGKFIFKKKAHYIIGDMDPKQDAILVKKDMIEFYKNDLIATKKMRKKDEKIELDWKYYDLPDSEKSKPLFYILEGDFFHFGFTPYLRMFYNKTVLDGVPKTHKKVEGISYVNGIFGFSNVQLKGSKKPVSYKSRVGFEDAVVEGEAVVDEESSVKLLLAEPKPTSYNLYLKQNLNASKKELAIYDGDFRIGGVKQYWLRDHLWTWEPEKGWSENMITHVHPLQKGTIFTGKIYFENLHEDELGLLLWALQLEEGCYQNLGLAKAYGYGRVKINQIQLKVENLAKKYRSLSFHYREDRDSKEYIEKYKKYFSNQYKEALKGKNIGQHPSVQELMYIKSKVISLAQANEYRYMVIDGKNNEFKNKKVLPSILEYENALQQKKNGKGTRNQKQQRQTYKSQGNFTSASNHKQQRGNLKNRSLGNQLSKFF